MIEIRVRVGVVLIKGGKILLANHVHENESYWVLPGGALERGETLKECAVREVKEETSLEIKVQRLLFVNEAVSTDRHIHVINIIFLGEIVRGELTSKPEGLFKKVEFMDADRLDEINFYPKIAKEIKEAYEKNFETETRYLQCEW